MFLKAGIWLLILCLTGCGAGAADKTMEASDAFTEEPKAVEAPDEEFDFDSIFQGVNGCAVIYNPKEEQYHFYNKELCEQEDSPYSTFKIISALAGLENGVVEDESSVMNYNGASYAVTAWNRNLTLKEAFQSSCVWYFHQVVNAVGEEEMGRELEALSYGNCDISQWEGTDVNPLRELNGFWLDASLKISPQEQVQVLADIFEGQSMYSVQAVAVLKELMFSGSIGDGNIYGKTGSGWLGKAWFVGFFEKSGQREYFAVYLDEQRAVSTGELAKEIAFKIFAGEDESGQIQSQDAKDDNAVYINYVKTHYVCENTSTLLADLTGDGRQELVVIAGEPDSMVSMEVFRIGAGDSVVRLYSDMADGSHAGFRWLYLYEEEGRKYLFSFAPTMYQGAGNYVYEIFSLTDMGEAKMLHRAEEIYDMNQEDEAELWERAGRFLDQVHVWQQASIPLVEIGEDYFDVEYGSETIRNYQYVIDCDELGIRSINGKMGENDEK